MIKVCLIIVCRNHPKSQMIISISVIPAVFRSSSVETLACARMGYDLVTGIESPLLN